MSIAKTKGVGFTNCRAFVLERFGEEGWAAVLATMSPADREDLRAVIPMGWYSLALYARLIRSIEAVYGGGRDMPLLFDLGRYEAEHDLRTIHRVLLRFANPAYVIEKTGELWRRFHDTGTWEVKRQPDGLTGVLSDWGYVDEALCVELVGYMGRCLELVGAKNVVMEHPRCRARGDKECRFRGSFSA
ncbi:MAG TPA: V4R domain-containing protein [Labilithrix sp.]|nr:V4R domain-containing protein [Labilithrix sp.]